MPPFLTLRSLTKRYGRTAAVDGVSLEIEKGRFLTLLGPSGSGKTTVLMMIAGFVVPTTGAVEIHGKAITYEPPEKRNFGMVFQGYALFPHMTVAENAAFSLKIRGRSRAEIDRSVRRALDMVQLHHLADRLPKQLSGGQQQRVAIARALAFEPELLLLDEPLSALDKSLRADVQEELRALHQRLGTTFICVTHDQEEALSLSDEIAILRDGKLEQVGSPQLLYNAPRSRFVAGFLGRSNFLDGIARRVVGGEVEYEFAGGTLLYRPQNEPCPQPGHSALIALRPDRIRVGLADPGLAPNCITGIITSISYAGSQNHVLVRTESGLNLSATVPAPPAGPALAIGGAAHLSWDTDAAMQVARE